ncbi:glycosyltransferase [Candidatus Curtissbacteria bacterium]|nr:glycosyltransferase [Candidatus Curtissbacteria bacterium]
MSLAVLSSPVLTAPPTERSVPPGWSGSPENVMLQIANGLSNRGHDVTLFASGDTDTKAKLESVGSQSSYEDPEIGVAGHKQHELSLIAKCYEMAGKGAFDAVHSRYLTESAAAAQLLKVPTISTLHSPLHGTSEQILRTIANAQRYVSLSDRQRIGFEYMNFADTIYNGVDSDLFSFGIKY